MSRTLVLAAAAALAVTLTGCSSGSDSTIAPAAQNSPPPVAGQPQSDLRASMEAQLGFPPKPDDQTARAYLADLKSIDPALVAAGTPDALVNRGRDQCRDLKVRPQKDWTTAASQRFTTPQAPRGLDPAAAEKIIKVVRIRLCPTF
ncbi:hypothetical protein ACTOB_006355 [Actinoplanes oblitus]|uniref:DUF732 domain-containing protein n=1 Tax=Actinoplanes oblitus TaxID=3040509 RepID=A0ABY8WB62_9ACTN|nr:hypothetical protein [Actinoplanes oblitus]WIM94338.1 hypothetical protein ACTOB_006355 [Actinoplanes oblitus]